MIATYEERLNSDLNWALQEGSRHFEQRSAVHLTLRRLATDLSNRAIPYAVCGGMALFFHGYRRFTEDVDLLVTRSGLDQIDRELDALGLIRLAPGGRHPRDAKTGVRVELLVTGDSPGGTKPKPVLFPEPAAVAVELAGIQCLSLPALVELKLASGLSGPGRLKDLADVQELIRVRRLPYGLVDQLNPWVSEMYEELWDGLEQAGELE